MFVIQWEDGAFLIDTCSRAAVVSNDIKRALLFKTKKEAAGFLVHSININHAREHKRALCSEPLAHQIKLAEVSWAFRGNHTDGLSLKWYAKRLKKEKGDKDV